jgi:hypothetical protein
MKAVPLAILFLCTLAGFAQSNKQSETPVQILYGAGAAQRAGVILLLMPWRPIFERSLINAMFLRFAVTQIDEDSHKPQGIFVAAYDLIDSCELTQEESKQLRELLDWFSEDLPNPPEDFYRAEPSFGSSRVHMKPLTAFGN